MVLNCPESKVLYISQSVIYLHFSNVKPGKFPVLKQNAPCSDGLTTHAHPPQKAKWKKSVNFEQVNIIILTKVTTWAE